LSPSVDVSGDIALTSTSRRSATANRLVTVVLFFEIMLVVAVVVISWFALYTLYRLITDES
jgi:hypothetical protein